MNNGKKLIISGDSGVGKTTLIHKLLTNEFLEVTQSTIAYDIKLFNIKMKNNIVVNLKIWDTAGQEEFKYLNKNYYQDAKIVIFCFNFTEKKSFENIISWIDLAKDIIEINDANSIIIGSKADLIDQIEVYDSDVEKLINQVKLPFFKFSSKKNTNEELREKIVSIFEDILIESNEKNDIKKKLTTNSNKRSGCHC